MYYFIVNPNAHGGRGAKIWKKLEHQIHKSGISYEAYQTEASGDARRMAAELTANMQEAATIVAVGGDGTVNEVLNGLAISDLLTFGYIPTGSGNDLARGLNLSRNPKKCLKRILNPSEICRVDYGILSYEDGSRFTGALWSAAASGLTPRSVTACWTKTVPEACTRSREEAVISLPVSNSF